MCSKDDDIEFIEEIRNDLLELNSWAESKKIECMFSEEADSNDCFIELHSGAGGVESDDWASMLLRMYMRWAEKNEFKISIVGSLAGEEAGIKYATLKIQGLNAYGWLQGESGIHRLVRISPFNSAGKRHTSFASVFISPVINQKIDIEINDADIRIDTYRASGAGGQHVNTTDSAVRITHIPTGIVAQSQSDRSQHKNKEACISLLKSKLYALELQKRKDDANKKNAEKSAIGWGNQIRSYVLHPYQMVKDLRTNHAESDALSVLDGKLDIFMKKYIFLHKKISDINQ